MSECKCSSFVLQYKGGCQCGAILWPDLSTKKDMQERITELEEQLAKVPKLVGDQNGRLAREKHDAVQRAEKAEAERDEALKHASIAAVENKRLREALKGMYLLYNEGPMIAPENANETAKQALQGGGER